MPPRKLEIECHSKQKQENVYIPYELNGGMISID
jgi:hypothetical protein